MSAPRPPLPLGGYVLAGGGSTRMGRDKALLELAGKPLAAHAVLKLRRFCAAVAILSQNPALAVFAPLVQDLHPGCGPISGMEAALAHSAYDWNLILPVDVPFVPTALLELWAGATLRHGKHAGTRISFFQVNGIDHPALLMLHRDAAPYLTMALAQGNYKLAPTLQLAGKHLAGKNLAGKDLAEKPAPGGPGALRTWAWSPQTELRIQADDALPQHPWRVPTQAQQQARGLWFANLNTPADLAEAERHLDALDT